MENKKRILITGANGLLGRRLCGHFSDTHDVHALVRVEPSDALPNATYHEIDFSQKWDESKLPVDVDTVFHLAQSSSFRNFPEKASDIFSVNIESTARLLDYSYKAGVKRFVYASSGGVYGSGAHAFHENSPIEGTGRLGYYLGGKLCGEILAESYAKYMSIEIARFFFMYGPEQQKGMLIPRLVESVLSGKPITIQGKEGISINPIHVSDAVNALASLMNMDHSRSWNIAGKETYSILQIANMIGDISGKAPVIVQSEGEPQSLVANIESMTEYLGAPQTSLSEGLKEICKSFE